MTKTAKKVASSTQKIAILVIATFVILLSIIAVYVFSQRTTITSDTTSGANIEIYQKAAYKSDPSICDEIKGGINTTDNNNPANRGKYPFSSGVSVEYKQMNETQARESCRVNAQRAIENRSRN